MEKREQRYQKFKTVAIALLLIVIFLCGNSQEIQAANVKISFNKKTVALEEGQKIQLKINLKNYKKQNLKWSSTNKSIVTVSSKGKIFAKKAGKAKIIVKAGKKKAVCSIIVNKNKKFRVYKRRKNDYT